MTLKIFFYKFIIDTIKIKDCKDSNLICKTGDDCLKLTDNDGIPNGNCVFKECKQQKKLNHSNDKEKEVGYCELMGWCPIEVDSK